MDFRLKQINVTSYRSIFDQTITFNSGINLLVGPNGSGKSNLLMAAAASMKKYPVRPDLDTNRFAEKPLQLSATSVEDIKIGNQYTSQDVRAVMHHSFYMNPLRVFHPQSPVITNPVNLSRDGVNLAGSLNYYRSSMAEAQDLELFRNRIKSIIPEVDAVKAPFIGGGNAELAIHMVKENKKLELGVENSPTGTLDAIFLVLSLHLFPGGSVYFLDSPDSHLHAGSQKSMMKLLRDVAKKESKQFIIATHSPHLVNMCATDEIIMVIKDGFKTTAEKISDKKNIIEILENTEGPLSDITSSMEPS